MRHTRAHKILPLLALLVVVGPIWYATSNHAKLNTAPQASANAALTTVSSAVVSETAGPDSTPTIQQSDGQVHVSVNTAAYAHVQRVEFYMENQLVGAAFVKPYIVSLDASTMQAGNHQVIAKIYTGDSTMQTQPTSFTPQPTATVKPPTDPAITQQNETPTIAQPVASPGLTTPENIIAIAGSDGVTARVQWDRVGNAESYQIWRDGAQIGTSTTTSYSDTGLQPSMTYDYQIIAVSGMLLSESSAIAAVTMPIVVQDHPNAQSESEQPAFAVVPDDPEQQ